MDTVQISTETESCRGTTGLKKEKKKESLAKLGMGGLYQGRLPKGGDN